MNILSAEISRGTQEVLLKTLLLRDVTPKLDEERKAFVEQNIDQVVSMIVDEFQDPYQFNMESLTLYLYDYCRYVGHIGSMGR